MSDIQTQLDELRAQVAELRAALPPAREVAPAWGQRTCQVCGAPADVIDLERPPHVLPQHWNGEGYCQQHALDAGVLEEGHPHMVRPGPKRKKT